MISARYRDEELTRIIDEATVYQCACPAQLAQLLLQMRSLLAYQAQCRDSRPDDLGVHGQIVDSLIQAQQTMEACLGDVLAREGWDLETLTMPEGLRRRLRDSLLDD
ncbi:MAG: hypothetical protein RBS40_03070 [Rhodocyclaceae bacterium]|jgi:hypothetical protein|nr:hypothetical protein [Rhodocyclaceae bacterium]